MRYEQKRTERGGAVMRESPGSGCARSVALEEAGGTNASAAGMGDTLRAKASVPEV